MARMKRKNVRKGGGKKQKPTSNPQQQPKKTGSRHGHRERHPSRRSPASSMEESGRLGPVVVEPSSNIEVTEMTPRWSHTIPGQRRDADCYSETTEGSNMSSSGFLDSRCLKVTFNPEGHRRADEGAVDDQTSPSLQPHLPPLCPPSRKGDALSVVIEKLTELVNDSERSRKPGPASGGSPAPVGVPRETQRSDSVQKCARCSCLFTPGAGRPASAEEVLCKCCDGTRRGTRPGSGEGKAGVGCELCPHVAASREDLLYHFLSGHRDARIYKCKLCDFFAAAESRIRAHAKAHHHHAPPVYKCSGCPFATGTLADLRAHLRGHHQDRELLLKCSECGFSCRCEETLRAHMWEHVPALAGSDAAGTPTAAKPKEPSQRRTSESSRPPSGSSPALPTPSSEREQQFVFKCLLCGYLCDRLATLKAHAWRHAGEQGCSYPVVENDERLKKSLSGASSTATTTAAAAAATTPPSGKERPAAIHSNARRSSPAESPKPSPSCCGGSRGRSVPAGIGGQTEAACGCCSGAGDSTEGSAGCHCDGINIPPSSMPLLKEMLTQKRVDLQGQADDSGNQSSDSSLGNPSVMPADGMQNPQQLVFAVADGIDNPLAAGGLLPERHSRISDDGVDSQVLAIDPADPRMLFLDAEVPQPAAVVEATTEPILALSSDQAEDGSENAFVPFAVRSARELPLAVERSEAIVLPHEGVLSSESHPASLPTPHTEESAQPALTNQDTSRQSIEEGSQQGDCAEGIRKEFKEEPESHNKTNSDLTLGSVSVVSSSSLQPPSQPSCQQNTSQMNPSSEAIQDANETSITDRKGGDACCTDVLLSQGRMLETLLQSTLRGESASMLKENARAETEHGTDSQVVAFFTSDESQLQTAKQSESVQERCINNNMNSAQTAAGLKRSAIDSHDESSKEAKRLCPDNEKPAALTSPDSSQGGTPQLPAGRQSSADRGKAAEESPLLDGLKSEDSLVMFFTKCTPDKVESFQCKLCSRTYGTYPLLKRHLQTHLVHNSYRCPLCQDRFDSVDSLKLHIQTHCSELFRCAECPAFFDQERDLEAHKELHSPFRCEACQVSFDGRAEFIRHWEESHSSQASLHGKCSCCGEGFSDMSGLLLHTLSCPKREMQSCKECSFQTETPEGLQDHVDDCHRQTKLVKCTQCDYSSSARNGLKNHKKFHAVDRPYKCQLCSYAGALPQGLRSHMRSHARPDWRPESQGTEPAEMYQCKLCCYTCNYLPALKSHMWSHAGDPSYNYKGKEGADDSDASTQSDVVSSRSTDNLKLMTHERRVHRCSECTSVFDKEADLEEHRLSHSTPVEAFARTACQEDFQDRSELDQHLANAHSEPATSRAKCTYCGEGFDGTKDLILHKLGCAKRKPNRCKEGSSAAETQQQALPEHAGDGHPPDNLYQCPLCDYKSSAKNGIKNHKKFHAVDRPYKCHLCSYTGAYPQSLRSHMRSHARPDWRPESQAAEPAEKYKCSLCCYTCGYLPALKCHMWKHASDPNYSYKGKGSAVDIRRLLLVPSSNSAGHDWSPEAAAVSVQQSVPPVVGLPPAAPAPPIQVPEAVCSPVTFCCQECGFQSKNRALLVEHLKTHIPPELLEAGKTPSKDVAKSKRKHANVLRDRGVKQVRDRV